MWLTGWLYRNYHLITGASGAVPNYPVAIKVYKTTGTNGTETLPSGNIAGKVYVGNHCRDDFGDIRFTDDDGNTELKYWKGTVVSGTSAIFWVKVSDDLISNQSIYVYYGKSDATTTSDFDNTFIFGDDLSSGSLNTNRWTSVDGNPTYTIDIGNYLEVTDMDGNNWLNGKGFHSKAVTLPLQWIIEDAYDLNTNGVYLYGVFTIYGLNVGVLTVHHGTWSSSDYGISCFLIGDYWGDSEGYLISAGVGGNIDYSSGFQSGSVKTIYGKTYKLSGAITIKLDGITRVDAESNSETPNIVHMGISRYSTAEFATQRFGSFKIRPYTSPEPAHSTWGNTEVSDAYDSMAITDSILRNKTFTITDSLGLSDTMLLIEIFEVIDSLGLTDTAIVIYPPATYKFHLPAIRLLMRPIDLEMIKTGIVTVAYRRSYTPYKTQRPAEGVKG